MTAGTHGKSPVGKMSLQLLYICHTYFLRFSFKGKLEIITFYYQLTYQAHKQCHTIKEVKISAAAGLLLKYKPFKR